MRILRLCKFPLSKLMHQGKGYVTFDYLKVFVYTKYFYKEKIYHVYPLSDCDNCFDFACLPTEHVEHGAGCHTAGWGYISADKTAKILQEVNINAMSDQYCVDHSRFYLR